MADNIDNTSADSIAAVGGEETILNDVQQEPQLDKDGAPPEDVCDEEIQRACAAIDDAYLAKELSEQNILQHRTKRKRNNTSTATSSTQTDLNEHLYNFQYSPYYLRIPASSVAGLCGLHPYQNLPQLLFDYVYQGYIGQLLLQQDAHLLGLTLVDAKSHEQETMLNIASAASKETKDLVKQVLEVSEGKRKINSVDEVQSIQKQIKKQATKAKEEGKLSKKQVDSLVEASRGHVSTGFGTCHEDEALDVYEKRIGCTVRERNEALMEWRFERVIDTNNELGVTAVPMGDAKRKVWNQMNVDVAIKSEDEKKKDSKDTKGTRDDPIEIDIDGDDNTKQASVSDEKKSKDAPIEMDIDGTTKQIVEQSDDNAATSSSLAVVKEKPKPFFRIVGAVDGIRDELYSESSALKTPSDTKPNAEPASSSTDSAQKQDEYNFSDDEEDQWVIKPIIVECKHRMNEAKVPPPLYDQIQTCLYCHMYQVGEADLIQVVRRKGKCEEKENDVAVKSSIDEKSDDKVKSDEDSGSTKQDIDITITRVSLNDPLHNHNHHWKATLLPRLASFVEAVYNIRKDDGKRYRLLMNLVQTQQEESCDSAEREVWQLLFDECPWLIHCDTSFGKKKRF